MNRSTLFVGALALAALTTHAADKSKPSGSVVVVVAAKRDLPAGTKVTFDDLDKIAVPKSLVTTSVIQADGAQYVVNQQLAIPALKGELLRWAAFETARSDFAPRCLQLTGAGRDAAEEIALSRARLNAAAKK